MRGSVQQSSPLKTYQARLLQSTCWPSYFRARHELACCAFTRTPGATYFSGHALVDDAWGVRAIRSRELETSLLDKCVQAWGRRLVHIFDRGFAGSPWIGICLDRALRFLMGWPKDYKLRDAQGNKRKAWQITRGKRSWAQRQVWDGRRKHWFQAGVVAVPVRHPEYEPALWLVGSRPGKGQLPWYLVTTEPIVTEQDAWSIVFAYARRWQIEMTWRYSKSELACESPRLWNWENRLKLLLMVSLVYAFLLTLLNEHAEGLRAWLLRYWCHR